MMEIPFHKQIDSIAVLQSLDEQLLHHDPPETREAYDRLISQGFDDQDVRKMLSIAIASEAFMILKHKERYDRNRFVADLRNLPRVLTYC